MVYEVNESIDTLNILVIGRWIEQQLDWGTVVMRGVAKRSSQASWFGIKCY